jgi:mannonate dehydratase
MEMTFRWYGPDEDTITLEQIRQIPGVSGVVGCLMDIPVGEVWPPERIGALVSRVHAAGLTMKVIESVNVHDDIKAGLPTRDGYIENYKQTIRNLAAFGIKVICYNFMPVFDWVKSDLDYTLPDGSRTLCFMQKNIPNDPDALLDRYAKGTNDFVLPGWEPERLAHIRHLFEIYEDVDEEALRKNLVYFLEALMPTCEKCDVRMAIHPDDPPYSLFGLPRIIKNRDDLDWLCCSVDTPYNGITLCTGSIAEDPNNDLYAILAEFSRCGRIHFVHARNIRYLDSSENKDFYEAAHYSPCGSLDMYKVLETLHDNGFDGYIRPDHGRMIWGEKGRPGYGLYDRALGTQYLLGIWEALEKRKGGRRHTA